MYIFLDIDGVLVKEDAPGAEIDLDANLRQSLIINLMPGVINIGGAFLFHFEILTSISVNAAFYLVGMNNAMLPSRKIITEETTEEIQFDPKTNLRQKQISELASSAPDG